MPEAAGAACLALVALAVAFSHPRTSPLVPGHPGGSSGWAWAYLGAAAAGFCAYLAGLMLLRRSERSRLVVVCGLAVAIQVATLAGPLLLSTDAYTYWDYGRIATVHGGNPYDDVPSAFPDDPAYLRMGAAWRETTSVYGPGFTLLSEAHAAGVGGSPTAAAWLYKGLAAAAMVACALLAARIARRKAFAAAFVGWNPLLALHFAGGGHNDAWMMALVLAALALAASERPQLAGAAWAAAVSVKWVALVFLPLRALEARRTTRVIRHLGFAVVVAVVAAIATWQYGADWLRVFDPIADNLQRQAQYSLPNRLSGLGISQDAAAWLLGGLFVLAYLWLLREAWRGRARLGLAAGLVLASSPWLVSWYAVWAVPLAAVEEDKAAQLLALALSAYLLRDAVPL